MHWSNSTISRGLFQIRKCQSLWWPMCLNCWQQNPISYQDKWFIKSMLQWKFWCTGLNRILHQKKGNFRCAWNVPDKRQPNDQRLMARGQSSNWCTKSIRWHLSNTSFSINYSNITSDNYFKKPGLRQLVPEAYSPENLRKWRLLPMNRYMWR